MEDSSAEIFVEHFKLWSPRWNRENRTINCKLTYMGDQAAHRGPGGIDFAPKLTFS